jgi:3-oxoacyl-[acyl-carrier-protein] synthase II
LSAAVVVTGLGTVGAFGCGREALAGGLAAGRPRLAEVDRAAGYHRPGGARRAALLGPDATAPLAEWVTPAEARRMSPPSRLVVASTRMALADAGLPRAGTGDPAAAVVVATAYGPSSFTEGLVRQIFLDNPEAASPFLFTESVANAPAAQVAIALRARGAVLTLCQREAGSLLALGRAAAEIASGRAPLALAGTVEEMTPLLHAVLARFGALAEPAIEGDGEEVARPFDRRRNGFLAAEGATMLALEPAAAARARGARVLARVLAWGSAFDPSASPSGWGRGEAGIAAALRRGLDRAGLVPGNLGAVVAGASGTRDGDRLEGLALRALFEGAGAALPPVVAPKSITGEYGGGFLASAVLAAAGAPFGPPDGAVEPDPELGIVPHAGGALAGAAPILVTCCAAGGAVAWVVLGAPEEEPPHG